MTAPLTATRDELVVLDAVEATLLADWADLATRHSADFITARIVDAVTYEPRFGLPMEVCDRHGCATFVTEDARDADTGRLWCSAACRDDASHAAETARYERAMSALADDEGRWVA